MPPRKRYLFVCTNSRPAEHPRGSCARKGSEVVLQKLKAGLLARGIAGEIRACSASCLDLCEVGVSVIQEPDHIVYGRVQENDVQDIVEALAQGQIVDRLVVYRGEQRPSGFTDPTSG